MTERKRALTDLRPAAEQTIFADFRVTPELKAKLHKRIEQAQAPTATQGGQAREVRPRVNRPWVRWGGGAAVAAAVMVALVYMGIQPLEGYNKETEQAASGSAGAKVPDGRMADTYGLKKESVAAAPESRPPEQSIATKTASAPGSAQVTVTPSSLVIAPIKDANGSVITVTAYDMSVSGTSSTTVASGSPAVPGVEAQPGRKVVLNAEYQLQVTDAVTAMQRFQNLAATTAGYVVDAGLIKGADGSWAGRLTLRLPSGQYNGAIQEIRRIGEVLQERQWSQDVTERYYDLEARIGIQQEYERKLQELAAKANTFDDWMKLTRQINDTRALIESMQGSLKLLANQVEYSTINIAFTQPAPDKVIPPPPPPPDKGLWPSMVRSFRSSLQWFADLGQAMLVGAAAFAPFLVALLILGLVALSLWRRWRPGRSA